MKPPLRIIDTGLASARWNVAMTAALAETCSTRMQPRPDSPPPCGEGLGVGGTPTSDVLESPPPCPSPTSLGRASGATGEGTLGHAPSLTSNAAAACGTVRFHRYPASVLLGAGQDAASAADMDYCRATGIEIARRVTGGGAVYMSPGMLAWDVLVGRRELGGDLATVTERIGSGVAAGLARLGAKARFQAPNDIEIGGCKVSGSAGYLAGHAAILQGTVLVTDEVPVMARALRLPEAALRERVTCLAAEIGTAPALQAVVECITMGLAEALGSEPVQARLGEDEIGLCEALLRDEIGTEAYVMGSAAPPA